MTQIKGLWGGVVLQPELKTRKGQSQRTENESGGRPLNTTKFKFKNFVLMM